MTDFFWVLTQISISKILIFDFRLATWRKAGWQWWARIFSGKRISVHRKLFQVSVFPPQQVLDRNSSCFLRFSALEDDSIYRCREQNFEPLTSSGHRSSWWHNHQHIFMPLKDTHHSHRASFLHIPTNKQNASPKKKKKKRKKKKKHTQAIVGWLQQQGFLLSIL